MTKAAVEAVGHVFREGFKYSKAEVLLLGLSQKAEYSDDLFAASQPVAIEWVNGVLDAINGRWGVAPCAWQVCRRIRIVGCSRR